MKRLIIGFGYRRRTGKDTATVMALRRLQQLNYQCRHDRFARTLKDVCRTAFGFSNEQIDGDLKEVVDDFWGVTPRWAQQIVGTECFRNNVCEDFWVKTLVRRAMREPETSVVISDVRFPNEVQAIKDLGGFAVACQRKLSSDPSIDQHPSETSLDGYANWDFYLNNNGTLDDLQIQVGNIITEMISKLEHK